MAADLRLLSWIFYNSKGACHSPFCPKLGNKYREDRSSGLKVIDIKKKSGWLPSCSHHLVFKKMNTAGNIPREFEVGHQISNGSVERFKSYRSFKNAKRSCCNAVTGLKIQDGVIKPEVNIRFVPHTNSTFRLRF
jgi:hypothetical protein